MNIMDVFRRKAVHEWERGRLRAWAQPVEEGSSPSGQAWWRDYEVGAAVELPGVKWYPGEVGLVLRWWARPATLWKRTWAARIDVEMGEGRRVTLGLSCPLAGASLTANGVLPHFLARYPRWLEDRRRFKLPLIPYPAARATGITQVEDSLYFELWHDSDGDEEHDGIWPGFGAFVSVPDLLFGRERATRRVLRQDATLAVEVGGERFLAIGTVTEHIFRRPRHPRARRVVASVVELPRYPNFASLGTQGREQFYNDLLRLREQVQRWARDAEAESDAAGRPAPR